MGRKQERKKSSLSQGKPPLKTCTWNPDGVLILGHPQGLISVFEKESGHLKTCISPRVSITVPTRSVELPARLLLRQAFLARALASFFVLKLFSWLLPRKWESWLLCRAFELPRVRAHLIRQRVRRALDCVNANTPSTPPRSQTNSNPLKTCTEKYLFEKGKIFWIRPPKLSRKFLPRPYEITDSLKEAELWAPSLKGLPDVYYLKSSKSWLSTTSLLALVASFFRTK